VCVEWLSNQMVGPTLLTCHFLTGVNLTLPIRNSSALVVRAALLILSNWLGPAAYQDDQS